MFLFSPELRNVSHNLPRLCSSHETNLEVSFFFYVNGSFQGEVRNSISTLKTGSPSERSEENVTVNKFHLLKKKKRATQSKVRYSPEPR